MKVETLIESAVSQITTPFQRARVQGSEVYVGREIDDAALALHSAVREVSLDKKGKPKKRELRRQYDALAAQEIKGQGWEVSEIAYKFYTRAVEDDLAGTVGAFKACQEMRRSHLKYLLKEAPVRKRAGYLLDFIGIELKIDEVVNALVPRH